MLMRGNTGNHTGAPTGPRTLPSARIMNTESARGNTGRGRFAKRAPTRERGGRGAERWGAGEGEPGELVEPL